MSHLPIDCLNEIIEYLDDDIVTLNSCILVDRFWCQVSMRILWRNVWNYSTSNFNTLIACLPKESKNILDKHKIIISTPISEPPTFNYATFCKILSVNRVHEKIMKIFNNQRSLSRYKVNKNTCIVVKEILNMFMNQTSLKSLTFIQLSNVNYNIYSGSKDYLKNLTELTCSSNISPKFFCQLSQICHNIQSLSIKPKDIISNGLADFISVQKNLKYFELYYNPEDFTNLQVLELLSDYDDNFKQFEKLQYIIFPQLRSLIIRHAFPRYQFLIKFLENNGKNLIELNLFDISCDSDNSLNLAISKFCSNLKKLSTGFRHNELETLRMVLNSCQYLESIKIWCGGGYLDENEALVTIVKYSRNIEELILHFQFDIHFELLPIELEKFFVSWKNRIPQKSLSLVIIADDYCRSLDKCVKNMKIIEKYTKLGVIKKFLKSCY
jgi:hypothetical protein